MGRDKQLRRLKKPAKKVTKKPKGPITIVVEEWSSRANCDDLTEAIFDAQIVGDDSAFASRGESKEEALGLLLLRNKAKFGVVSIKKVRGKGK